MANFYQPDLGANPNDPSLVMKAENWHGEAIGSICPIKPWFWLWRKALAPI